MHRKLHHHLRAAIGLVAAVLVLGCGADSTTAPDRPLGEFVLTASVEGTTVSTLVVLVTGEDITTPLAFNIEIKDGKASGTIKVPPGTARTITVKAFDISGDQTHEGSTTVDVKPGANNPVSIALISLYGELPIDVVMGSVSVSIIPSSMVMTTGRTLQLQVRITKPSGEVLPGPAAFATLNPAIATVDAQGIVTALRPGSVDIVATYAGVGASASLIVHAPRVAVIAGGLLVLLDAASFTEVGSVTLPLGARSVAVDNGRAYVGANGRIHEVDLRTMAVETWPLGSLTGDVYGVSVRNGVLYATTQEMSGIEKFDLDGTHLGTIASQSQNGGLTMSAFGPDGSFYATPLVQRWSPGFVPAGTFGQGYVTSPYGIGVRANGNVLVVDFNADYIFIFTSNGSFIGTVAVGCGQAFKFGLSVDATDGIWVTCSNEIVKFNSQNQVVARKPMQQPLGIAAY